MSQTDLSSISQEQLLTLCSRGMYAMDGLWFTAVEQKYGFEAALELDLEVWDRLCRIQAGRTRKTFGIDHKNPLETLLNLIEVEPLFTVFKPQIVAFNGSKIVFRFTKCPPQKARMRDGKTALPVERWAW